MLKGKGKVWRATRSNPNAHVIYIPTDLVKDSAYPFQTREAVNVEIDAKEKRLIITKRIVETLQKGGEK